MQINNKPVAYFIGIKGVGMTMLAQMMKGQGYEVSGSDVAEEFMTDQVLKRAKIQVFQGFSKNNVNNSADIIIYSIAYNHENNVELAYAIDNGLKLLSFSEAVGEAFSKFSKGIAVCGSHGKTSTSAALAYVLWKGNRFPNAMVGARVPQFGGSALLGKSQICVAEADEYGNKLRYFKPFGIILSSIDYDHPDYFKDLKSYNKVFTDFIKKIDSKGFLVANFDDKQVVKTAKNSKGEILSYALHNPLASYRAQYLRSEKGRQYFKVYFKKKDLGVWSTYLLGDHNIYNSLAVIASARKLGMKFEDIKKHLASFKGTARRAQILGKYKEATVIDDYAHHPTEVETTLAGLRRAYKGSRITVVFHPHTFSRTEALLNSFSTSFNDADRVLLLDVYSSAREKKGKVGSLQLFKLLNKYKRDYQDFLYVHDFAGAKKELRKNKTKKDLIVLMGAGDVFRLGEDLVK